MSIFLEFLRQGFFHILDFEGLDHLLFLLVIGVVFSLRDWKSLLWVLTAFTLAHSLSLALSLLNIIDINTNYIEFLIPATIFFTCVENVFFMSVNKYRIFFAGLFGLIHGLGFSSYLKELFLGMNFNLFQTLLPFNIGIEIAQIVIIGILLVGLHLFYKLKWIQPCHLIRLVSAFVGVQAIVWMIERYPF